MSWDGLAVLIESSDGLAKSSSGSRASRADATLSLKMMKTLVEDRLKTLLVTDAFVPVSLSRAMSHALMGGGKRFRPLFFISMIKDPSKQSAAIDIGCAIEMVHSASLILDDLPCMDNADLRRQQVTTHRAFGEATAILAAISLLTRGMNIISAAEGVEPELRAKLVEIISNAIGHEGLAGGQELDLNGSYADDDLASIEQKNWLKTGALFVATALMAGLLDGKPEEQRVALAAFAGHIGAAFQTMDDYLDTAGAASVLGKDTGKDVGKSTIASRLGPTEARSAYLEHLRLAYALLPHCGLREEEADVMLKSVFQIMPIEAATA
jgi:geranylgeranyl diphosphate synthase type II